MPSRIKDHQDRKLKLGSTIFLNQTHLNTTSDGIIHIEVESKPWTERHGGIEVVTRTGLSTSVSLTHSFTILCGTWSLLNARNPGPHLDEETTEACRTQETLETTDNRTPTRYVLRGLKKLTRANMIHGLTSITAPGFFHNASRGPTTLWGEKNEKKTLTTRLSMYGIAWTQLTKTNPSKISNQPTQSKKIPIKDPANFEFPKTLSSHDTRDHT